MAQIELSEDELNEMGYGDARAGEHHFATHGIKNVKKSKYHVKHKVTGKIISTHASAPDAVRARAKLGGSESHSIIKEEQDLTEQVSDLIQAISLGKSLDIESAFNEVMTNKMINAIDIKRTEIANSLFNGVQEDTTVEEAVVPGSVKKDKDGNVLSAKTVPDAHHGKDNKPKLVTDRKTGKQYDPMTELDKLIAKK